MAGVKWIRLNTDMFDNAKIKYLRTLPEGNNIVLFWVMLLAKAGKCNSNGYIFLTENIPYSPEMLAAEFDFEVNTVNLALMSLSNLNMIQLEEHILLIPSFDEHQNAEGLDKIREQTKKRVAKYREKQKRLESNVTSNVTVTQSNALDIERDKEEDKEKEIDINNISKDILCSTFVERVIESWNSLGLTSKLKTIKAGTKRYSMLKARVKQYSEDEIVQAINNIKESSFLMGRVKDFEITFDWFIRPNNFIKVLENNY
ncbi:phage replisome organizer N-terminal domain-containing protein, partial [Clostridium thermobutyricum]|uniref:phage replisome organizer N-terminal domain-containing protein n=1 Tax=Clostridium thermobutyricum TaxID=29372 RepID=UPI0009AD74BF